MIDKKLNTVDNYSEAEAFIIKTVQNETFKKEIENIDENKSLQKNSRILSLNPFMDNDGLLRVGGRLEKADITSKERHPVIIPGNHHIAILLVRYFHEKVKHQGRHLTEGSIRSAGYWITGVKRLVSSIIQKCVKCRKLRGKQQFQKMSSLPQDRVTIAPPFTHVGVDTFGPWEIVSRRTRGGLANSKRWAIMFTCLTIRAVHIELVDDMSSSAFINALRRFTAIRGHVKEFRSDRGTNFVGATDDLNILAINVEDTQVKDLLTKNQTVWIFNPPHASHMGGVWERMIGVTRRILDSILSETVAKQLTHDVLSTFMAEVTAIVNSRPIVPVSSDPEVPEVLSPSLLLTQKSDIVDETFSGLNEKDMYRSQWKRVQALSNIFWNKWRKEYLHTLQTRRKWETDQPNILEGDVVLLRDSQVHRSEWPVGIITQSIPSDDGKVRKVKIRVIKDGKPTYYIRPIVEVVLLVRN